MPASSKPLNELFGATPATKLDWTYINRLLSELSSRIGELQVLKASLDGAIAQAENIALERVNEILGPSQILINAILDDANQVLAQLQDQVANAADSALSDATTAVETALANVTTATNEANTATTAAIAATANANGLVESVEGHAFFLACAL